jgi:hypothetical protein
MAKWLVLALIVILFLGGGGYFAAKKFLFSSAPVPTPTLEPASQLPSEKHPQVNLEFSKDGHYVTVKITNIFADRLEYNLIYDAKVKGNVIQTGVAASAQTAGQSEYSREQLLGSESSGKYTYHENIQNAVLELTLRDAASRSIFTATYPFIFSPSQSVPLSAQ